MKNGQYDSYTHTTRSSQAAGRRSRAVAILNRTALNCSRGRVATLLQLPVIGCASMPLSGACAARARGIHQATFTQPQTRELSPAHAPLKGMEAQHGN